MLRSTARASKPSAAPDTGSAETAAETTSAADSGRQAHRRGSWWGRRSLRARLTAAATAVILVAIAGAASLLVVRLHTSLLANLDTTVTQQVQAVAGDAARGRLPHPLPAAAEGAAAAQIIDSGGQVVTSSANVDGEDRLFTFPAGRGEPALATAGNVPAGDGDTTYRVAGLATATPTGGATVYVGLPTSEVDQSVTELIGALAVGGPVIVVLLALVGWLLVGRALRPVEAMRRQAAAIPGADLHRRLDLPAADDELGRLAVTLNELLSRIEAATGRQRQFVADAAHELRSPLASLRTQLEVTVRHPDPTGADTVRRDMLADTIRMSRLVDDLLQLARLDAGPRPQRQQVDLDDLVLDEARRSRGRGPKIDTTGVHAARVLGDAHALTRVIQNLVDNAVRHGASIVTLRLAGDAGTATLSVADDGLGIAPADRNRVFERFTRLDDARSRDGGGSGLGLAIVSDVVAAHGGKVRVDDNHPGALFTVTLPASG